MSEILLKYANNRQKYIRIWQSLLKSPTRIVILGFAFFIISGAILLMLPMASTGNPLGFIDALFTSTSAVCVTGLTVVDTGKAFSGFGQLIILILIQAGGLGIMTVSTLFLMLTGRRPSLTGQMIVQDTYTHSGKQNPISILKDIVLFTFAIEGAGIILLFFYFFTQNDWQKSLFLAVFHSISAFCNAGFSLFSDSFVAYRESWMLNLVICFLIVSGGLGFLVLSELKQKILLKRRTWLRLSLHSKIVLSTTAIMIFSGTVLVMIMEWNNTLAHLSVQNRIIAAFFQSVTARTAGFNTLPIGQMANVTLFLLIVLMFIGASPGSCGGGIKTTSLATIVALGTSRFQGWSRPQLFRRTISEKSIRKAIRVVMLSTFVVCIGIILLQTTELGGVSHLESRGMFLELLFEVISAFGTVGLSTGTTAGLSTLGKLVITGMMFVGRLGPLAVGTAVSRRLPARYYYAEETIMIG